VVDETRFERKKRERLEEAKETREKKAWEEFRQKHTEQRKRKKDDENIPEGWRKPDQPRKKQRMSRESQEPACLNLIRGWDSGHRQVEKDDMDIGYCLTVMEGICQRAGVLMKKLEHDKRRVLRRMESLEHDTIISDLPSLWEAETEELPEGRRESVEFVHEDRNSLVAGHPRKTPHSISSPDGEKVVKMAPEGWNNPSSSPSDGKVAKMVPEGWNNVGGRHPTDNPPVGRDSNRKIRTSEKTGTDWSMNMLGLVGWWRRLEQEQSRQENLQRKEENKKIKEITGRNKQEEEKLSFIRKFFPNCTQTPGGTVKLNKELHKKRDSNLGHPSSGNVKTDIRTEHSLTPISKRKAGEGGNFGHYFSPQKRLRFRDNDSSESGNLTDPPGGLALTSEGTMKLAEKFEFKNDAGGPETSEDHRL
jgi:hypothetical protein